MTHQAADGDAELLRLCAELDAVTAEWNRLYEPFHDVRGGCKCPDTNAKLRSLSERLDEVRDEIADTAAFTPAGRRAKAMVSLDLLLADAAANTVDDIDDPNARVHASLIADILREGAA